MAMAIYSFNAIKIAEDLKSIRLLKDIVIDHIS